MHLLHLTPAHRAEAHALFAVFARVFDEPAEVLSDEYLDRLLRRDDFVAIAAFENDIVIGGIAAHTLPMTRAEASELFIYDLAVLPEHQRRGVGRRLVQQLCAEAMADGVDTVFVPADNDDRHALDFYNAIGGAAAAVTFFTFTA